MGRICPYPEKKGVKFVCQQNERFINGCCEICGGSWALSELHIICGYGSMYDGEKLSLSVCGECIDRIYNDIINKADKE